MKCVWIKNWEIFSSYYIAAWDNVKCQNSQWTHSKAKHTQLSVIKFHICYSRVWVNVVIFETFSIPLSLCSSDVYIYFIFGSCHDPFSDALTIRSIVQIFRQFVSHRLSHLNAWCPLYSTELNTQWIKHMHSTASIYHWLAFSLATTFASLFSSVEANIYI